MPTTTERRRRTRPRTRRENARPDPSRVRRIHKAQIENSTVRCETREQGMCLPRLHRRREEHEVYRRICSSVHFLYAQTRRHSGGNHSQTLCRRLEGPQSRLRRIPPHRMQGAAVSVPGLVRNVAEAG